MIRKCLVSQTIFYRVDPQYLFDLGFTEWPELRVLVKHPLDVRGPTRYNRFGRLSRFHLEVINL